MRLFRPSTKARLRDRVVLHGAVLYGRCPSLVMGTTGPIMDNAQRRQEMPRLRSGARERHWHLALAAFSRLMARQPTYSECQDRSTRSYTKYRRVSHCAGVSNCTVKCTRMAAGQRPLGPDSNRYCVLTAGRCHPRMDGVCRSAASSSLGPAQSAKFIVIVPDSCAGASLYSLLRPRDGATTGPCTNSWPSPHIVKHEGTASVTRVVADAHRPFHLYQPCAQV